MNDKKLLGQIGILIEEKLEPIKDDLNGVKKDLNGVKQQLNLVEMKVELVNKRVEQAQHETIEALSELVNTGYNLHEERLKHVEEHINLPLRFLKSVEFVTTASSYYRVANDVL